MSGPGIIEAEGEEMTFAEKTKVPVCPFRIGSRVKVKPDHKFAADWRGVFLVTGVEWAYQRGDGTGINISIASEDEIQRRDGSADGWAPNDLLPA